MMTPTKRKSRRIMMNASFTASKKVYEYTMDHPMAAAAKEGWTRRTRGDKGRTEKAAREENEYGWVVSCPGVLCLCKRGRTQTQRRN